LNCSGYTALNLTGHDHGCFKVLFQCSPTEAEETQKDSC